MKKVSKKECVKMEKKMLEFSSIKNLIYVVNPRTHLKSDIAVFKDKYCPEETVYLLDTTVPPFNKKLSPKKLLKTYSDALDMIIKERGKKLKK